MDERSKHDAPPEVAPGRLFFMNFFAYDHHYLGIYRHLESGAAQRSLPATARCQSSEIRRRDRRRR